MADKQRQSREVIAQLHEDEKVVPESALTVKVGVDVSEAITGLKAIQREAKEATRALREVESASQTDIKRISTRELVEELSARTDVKSYFLKTGEGTSLVVKGPAHILVSYD